MPRFGPYLSRISGTCELSIILQGTDDYQTPTALARAYYDSISATKREIVLIEGACHLVPLVMPDRILQELAKRVRPVVLDSGC
jgi:pimeloyl-ACP methyl ester carboxylesterase